MGYLNFTAYQSLQNLFIIKENTTGSILEFLYNETPRLPNGTREISLDFTALTTSARLSINPFVGYKLYIQSFRIIQLPDAPAITPPAELVSTGITSPVLCTPTGTNMNLSVGTANSTIVALTDTAKTLIFKPRIIPQAQYQLQFDIQWPAGSTHQQKTMQSQGISVAVLNTNFTAGANTASVNFVGGAIDGIFKLTFGIQGVTISNIKYTVQGSPVVMADSARTIRDNYTASDTLWSRTVVNGNLVLAPNNSTAACTLSRQFSGLVVGRTYRLLIAVPNSGAPTTGTFANIIAEGSTTPMFTIEANLAWQTITSSNYNTNAPRSGYSQVNGTGLKEYYLIFKATTSTITINYLGAKTNANLGGRSLRHIKLIQEPVFEGYSENDLASGYRYGFNGKEKENTLYNSSNAYDFGARLYDSRLGRWFGIDPLATKYPGISTYVFVANNPFTFVDPDGAVIIVAKVADREPILKMINSKALGLYAFDKSGRLYKVKATGDESKFSKYYSDKLDAAIKDADVIDIKISQTYSTNNIDTKDVDNDAGGGVTFSYHDVEGNLVGPVRVVISGNENKGLKDTEGNDLEDKPEDILVHELVGHAIPRTVGTDTGNAVENENKVRAEVKKAGTTTSSPLRATEPDHIEKSQ